MKSAKQIKFRALLEKFNFHFQEFFTRIEEDGALDNNSMECLDISDMC